LKADDKYQQIVYYSCKNIDWESIEFPDGFDYLPKPN